MRCPHCGMRTDVAPAEKARARRVRSKPMTGAELEGVRRWISRAYKYPPHPRRSFSQSNFAFWLGISRRSYTYYVSGKHPVPEDVAKKARQLRTRAKLTKMGRPGGLDPLPEKWETARLELWRRQRAAEAHERRAAAS